MRPPRPYGLEKSGLLLAALLLAGCATGKAPSVIPIPVPIDYDLAACRTLYRQVDAAIERAGVRDHGPSPLQDFPYLRTTRLLASFRDQLNQPEQWSAWTGQMARLDAEARALELRNLPAPLTDTGDDALRDQLDRCRVRLLAADLAQPGRRDRLRAAAQVPDDYVTWWRVAGLYPLTAPLVSVGISAWHRETHAVFATPLANLPVAGRLVRWASPPAAPLDAAQVREILRRSRDLLGIPRPPAAEFDRLFATFAPVWEVDVVDDDDRIGMPYWRDGPRVDVAYPMLYRKLSHARYGSQVLLQLNYIVWFPARPGSDLYAGRLDGLDWRVTLAPDGEPWFYDAIHNCGCYHMFFPGRDLHLRTDLPDHYFEPPLLPQPAPEQRPLVLRIAHRTHYIQRVHHDETPTALPAAQLVWEEYDALRSLPADGGHRSLFGAYGLVAGSERSERFLLWPMGIRSPGGMRQWGRHATAFVGRRHFDDPFLIESLFERAP